MSWKNLKIFAIAVLFVMNLFFGYAHGKMCLGI